MLSPLPRHSDGRYCFAHSPQSCQPSLIWPSGRPVHRPFRGFLSVHSRFGPHTSAVTAYRDTLSEGFSHFVTSIAAPVASGWSVSPGGACTHWKAPPSHGARHKRSFRLLANSSDVPARERDDNLGKFTELGFDVDPAA